MKILIVSPGFLPITGNHGGAIENLINQYLKYNESKNDEIVVYSVKRKNYKCDEKIYNNVIFRNVNISSFAFRLKQKILRLTNKIVDLKLKRLYIKYVINDLVQKKEQNYYDLIIFENGQDFIEYFSKRIKTKSKKVLHLHNDYLNKDKKNSKEILHLFDEVWTVSEFIKNKVNEIDTSYKNIKVLYNCIEYDNFTKKLSKDEKTKLKNNLKINENDFVFLYVGRIMKAKGVYELVKSFNILNEKYDDIKLIVVGGGKGQNKTDEYITNVHNIANKNIIFTGQVNNKQIYKYYQISDVQVVPSIWVEAFGLIVLEGVASNIPLICTNSGGIPEVIHDNCLSVDVDKIDDELIKQMEYAYKNKKEIIKLTKNYKEIINKFSKENYLNNFYNLIHSERK